MGERRREGHVDGPVSLRRDEPVTDLQAVDPPVRAPDRDQTTEGDTQHFHGKGRHGTSVDHRDRRDSPDDRIRILNGVQQPLSGSGSRDARDGLIRTGECRQHLFQRRIGERHGHGSHRPVDTRAGAGTPKAQHDRPCPNHFRQNVIVVRQGPDIAEHVRRRIGHAVGQVPGGLPVRIEEQHIDTDGQGPALPHPVDQVSDHGTRPGPLPDFCDAALVHRDDHRQVALHRARHQLL